MRLTSPLLTAALIPLLVAPAVAVPRPSSIPLPVDFQPEGIAVKANTFYVGSLRDGDIYRGNLRTGQGTRWIDVSGRAALGMRVDRARNWLVVAGGATGHAWVYDLSTGTTAADLVLGPAGSTFSNDVAITRRALYFTETFAPTIYKVPIRRDGTFGATEPITVTGPAAAVGGFGLNGIDSTHRRWLVVDHSSLGILALVNPRTGVSRQIQLSGPALVPGTPDGVQVEGRTVWVVQNFANSLVKIRLSPDLTRGRVVKVITSSLFQIPTTVARHGRWLALVNARFDLGDPPPFGSGAPPGTEFNVVQIKP
jgi:hypothetical protein